MELPCFRQPAGIQTRETGICGRGFWVLIWLPLFCGCAALGIPPWASGPPSARLDSTDPEERIAALDVATSAPLPLPEGALKLLDDPDPRVRTAALTAIALTRDARAEAEVVRRLGDANFSVQVAAVEALAALDTASARRRLEELCQEGPVRIRVAAIGALGRAGRAGDTLRMAQDDSWQVRRAVARVLGDSSPEIGMDAALRLVGDRNAGVQREVVSAVQKWPWPASGAVWLEAMGSEAYLVRKAAAEQLMTHWPEAAAFPLKSFLDANSPTHEDALAELDRLRKLWVAQFAAFDRASLAKLSDEFARDAGAVLESLLDKVRALVSRLSDPERREESIELLTALGTALPPVLEHLAFTERHPLPEEVFSEVLPRIQPSFEYLRQLGGSDVQARRMAADALLRESRKGALSNLAAERLAWQVARDDDPVVWLRALEVLANDTRSAAARLAVAATGHENAAVRRAGCTLLGNAKDDGQVRLLMDMLRDTNEEVVAAAADALGNFAELATCDDLLLLLQSRSSAVQLAAATTLSKMDNIDGIMTLRRLARDPNRLIRRQAAQRMAMAGRNEFVPDLIAFLDAGPELRRVSLAALPAITGYQPPLGTDASDAARCAAWKEWHAKGGARASGSGS